MPSVPSVPVSSFASPLDAVFRTLSWRTGTIAEGNPPETRRAKPSRGPLQAAFAAQRVRVADGPEAAGAQHLPGEERCPDRGHRTPWHMLS